MYDKKREMSQKNANLIKNKQMLENGQKINFNNKLRQHSNHSNKCKSLTT